MPTRVHAVVVARPGSTAHAQLLRTLDALSLQSRRPDAITLVVCGDPSAARESEVVARSVEGIIETRSGTSFANAVDLARPRIADGSAVWLLAHDTAPHREALAQLAGALERSPSAAIAAPKLVHADREREIVSLGESMTRLGRSVDLAAGELDQGQHDGRDDALGADIRGLLIRSEVRDRLRPDPALAGADEGLDLGVRARLAGGRVVLAPSARIAVHPDGPAAPPQNAAQRAYATRRAQLHRRLTYAPAIAVPFHWLSLLPLALWRTIVHLVGKRPAAVIPEWAAAVSTMVQLPAVARSRRSIREFRTAPWSSIAPLRVTRSQLRRRLDDGHGSEGGAVSELHFFAGGGAWVVLAALVVSVASFTSLLAWPALGGGALLPLRDTVTALWRDAAWGLRGAGVDLVGPADPFAGVLAVLGTLWPGAPSFAVVLLWLLALPLAVLGGWFAATRITDRAGLRIFGGIVWALAPTFLTALVEGRPAAVLVHLLLPWLFHTAVVAHRSWGAAGAASIVLAATLACAPSLGPAAIVLWLTALIIALAHGWFRGAVRVLWVLVPSAAAFAPLVFWQLQQGNPLALLADPGQVWPGPQAAADAAGRMLLATGFPTGDLAGWADVVDPGIAVWAPLLLVPLALLALAAAVAPRWGAGIMLLGIALSGLLTAFLAVGVTVSFAQGEPVAIWPGASLSLAWAGVVGAALVTLDTAVTLPRLRSIAAVLAGAALAVCAVPALTALHTDRAELRNGPASTLPAFVAAEARGDVELGTLVLTAQNDGGLAADLVWGASDTLSAQTTMLSTATEPHGEDISGLAVDLLSSRDFDAPEELAARGIHFVLLGRLADDESDAAREFRLSAVTALDQRAGFVRVGETDRGVLWRLDAEPAPRAEPTRIEQGAGQTIVILQIVVILAALLLAVPTRASRRAARAQSRIVGRSPEEPMVLPRRHDDLDPDDDAVGHEHADAAREDGEPTGAADTETVRDEDAPDADATSPASVEASESAGGRSRTALTRWPWKRRTGEPPAGEAAAPTAELAASNAAARTDAETDDRSEAEADEQTEAEGEARFQAQADDRVEADGRAGVQPDDRVEVTADDRADHQADAAARIGDQAGAETDDQTEVDRGRDEAGADTAARSESASVGRHEEDR